MQNYFSARISQEYLSQVEALALTSNVPPDQIVFKKEGCPLGSIGVYIKFETKANLDDFSKSIHKIPCILEKW